MNLTDVIKNSTQNTVTLRDGRKLGYAEVGTPNGVPVLYFHGMPTGSRAEVLIAEEVAQKYNLRLIGLDRPGIGLSDYVAERSLYDWPDDVINFAEQLNLKKFNLLAVSGGTPYALACAHKHASNIDRVIIINGMCTINEDAFYSSHPLARLLLASGHDKKWVQSIIYRLLERNASINTKYQDTPVKKFITRKIIELSGTNIDEYNLDTSFWQERSKEAFKHGFKGPLADAQVLVHPWPFDLKEITTEVELWYAVDDPFTPPQMGEFYKSSLPNSQLFLIDGGHVAMLRHGEAILKRLSPTF